MEQNFKKPKKLSKRNNPKSKIKFNKRNIKTLIHTLKREKAFDRLLEISNDKNHWDIWWTTTGLKIGVSIKFRDPKIWV